MVGVAHGEGVGEGDTAGIWQGMPNVRADFREKYRKAVTAQTKNRKSEEMV